MRPGYEILIDTPMASRGLQMLKSLALAGPIAKTITTTYQGIHKWLIVYGAGKDNRWAAINHHHAKGGRFIVWDLGYWNRETSMRMAVDGLHPNVETFALVPTEGQRERIVLREDSNPEGPILLVGMGRKSARLHYGDEGVWERNTLDQLLHTYPGKKVVYRPKDKSRIVNLRGAETRATGGIEDVLKGCSLVVCRHSNVGVDACFAGIPVQSEDGAACLLYKGNPNPTREQRHEFLRRLGWFNWSPKEARQVWNWIERIAA